MKIPQSKPFQGEYLFPRGSTYLLVNKYYGSSYFPVSNYWEVRFSGESLLTVTPDPASVFYVNFKSAFRRVHNYHLNIRGYPLTLI